MSKKLNEKAVIVHQVVGGWTGRKHDKKVSEEVDTAHGTQDAGRYNKRLVKKEDIDVLAKIITRARSVHYENTLPWFDGGGRILPVGNFANYEAKMKVVRDEFEAAVRDFCNRYEGLIADAKARLNGLFNQKDYPTPKEMRRKWRLVVDIYPVPDVKDFRVDLSDSEVNAMRKELEAKTKSLESEAMGELWGRFRDAIDRMVDRLTDEGGEKKIFRDSLISNVQELVGLIPALNLTEDKKLESIRKRMEKLVDGLDAQTLRDDDELRKETATAAKDILEKMAGYMGD